MAEGPHPAALSLTANDLAYHVQLPRRNAHCSHSSPRGLTQVPTSAPPARVENSSSPPRCRQYVDAGFGMPTAVCGGAALSGAAGYAGDGGGGAIGCADGAGGSVAAGAGGAGGGAGSMTVRGGCHGGIGDEQAARPTAKTQAAMAAAALRP